MEMTMKHARVSVVGLAMLLGSWGLRTAPKPVPVTPATTPPAPAINPFADATPLRQSRVHEVRRGPHPGTRRRGRDAEEAVGDPDGDLAIVDRRHQGRAALPGPGAAAAEGRRQAGDHRPSSSTTCPTATATPPHRRASCRHPPRARPATSTTTSTPSPPPSPRTPTSASPRSSSPTRSAT